MADGKGRYASVNGLRMYYEEHGPDSGLPPDPPLVLLHAALSAIGTSFGPVLPLLARVRRVIAVEQQGHGRTADIDQPLSAAGMAEDTAALLDGLGVGEADFFGYGMGGGTAVQLAIDRPDLVRRLVLATPAYSREGFHAGAAGSVEPVRPEDLEGTPFHREYAEVAPNPGDWAGLVAKANRLNAAFEGWEADTIRSLRAPVLLVAGDSDIVRLEHVVRFFGLVGGGPPGCRAGDGASSRAGDGVSGRAGPPSSRLAILPGTTHLALMHRPEWLSSMVHEFLDAKLDPNRPPRG